MKEEIKKELDEIAEDSISSDIEINETYVLEEGYNEYWKDSFSLIDDLTEEEIEEAEEYLKQKSFSLWKRYAEKNGFQLEWDENLGKFAVFGGWYLIKKEIEKAKEYLKEEVIQKLEGERNKLTENKSVCIKIDDNWTLSDMVNAQRESYYIDSIDYLNLENLKKIELKDLIEGILTNEDLKIINDDLINENGIAHIDEESFLQLNSLDSVIESAEYDIKQRIKYLEESMNED